MKKLILILILITFGNTTFTCKNDSDCGKDEYCANYVVAKACTKYASKWFSK